MARFGKTIKDLALALVNATLLLAIVLGVVLLLVMNKASDLVAEVEEFATEADQVATILSHSPLMEELDQLQENLATANAALEAGSPTDVVALAAQLGSLQALLEEGSSQRATYIREITRSAVETIVTQGVSGITQSGSSPATSE